MKIDICIPTYNRRNLLQVAIESALRQSYPDTTIIVSDNASEDGTIELMQSVYAENPKIRYFRNEMNIWALENCRKCVYEHSRGDYILFLSDDDELVDPQYLTKAIAHLKNYPTSRIVIGNTRISYTDIGISFDEDKQLAIVTPGKEFFLNYGIGDYTISWCNAIFHRQSAIDTGSYDGSVFYVDSDSFFRIMLLGDVGFINTIASIYAVHAKNSYKIATVDTYLDNQLYITQNYDRTLKLWLIEKDLLDAWKERLLFGYRISMIYNLILFSADPIKNLCKALGVLWEQGFAPGWKLYIKIPFLYIAHFAIRFKPVFRFLIVHNRT